MVKNIVIGVIVLVGVVVIYNNLSSGSRGGNDLMGRQIEKYKAATQALKDIGGDNLVVYMGSKIDPEPKSFEGIRATGIAFKGQVSRKEEPIEEDGGFPEEEMKGISFEELFTNVKSKGAKSVLIFSNVNAEEGIDALEEFLSSGGKVLIENLELIEKAPEEFDKLVVDSVKNGNMVVMGKRSGQDWSDVKSAGAEEYVELTVEFYTKSNMGDLEKIVKQKREDLKMMEKMQEEE